MIDEIKFYMQESIDRGEELILNIDNCETLLKYIIKLQDKNRKYKDLYDELLKQYSKESIFCKIILEKLRGEDNE